ncbi:MAG: radical SAM protein [Oscillospiraceae bacterium]|nr:radical SAM protein [Oscillospiraceae bacterium]
MIGYEKCELCPRRCRVNRHVAVGFCGQSDKIRIARAALHLWEEPCISIGNGSGAVFFSGCTLRCCFCQNHEISHEGKGFTITTSELAEIFLRLQSEGAENINLVSPTPFVPSIIEALDTVRDELKIPVVYNCGGFESVETIKALEGYVDIYLPDVKYFSDEYAKEFSGCAGSYFETAISAVKEMQKQVGKPRFDESGKLLKGVIVRHMVLPTLRHDSMAVLRALRKSFEPDEILLSLMCQYVPMYLATTEERFRKINRRVSTFEYNSVLDYARELGFEGYSQERSSSDECFVPEFFGSKELEEIG